MIMNCEQEIYNLDSNEYFFAKIFDHLEKLDKKSNASVFRPYQEIIDDNNNRALTLDQIYKALLRGEYRNNIWFLIRDYTKALSFIVNYYHSSAKIYKNASNFYNILSENAEKHMKELGFCCGIWYQHESKILTCEKSCNIENNQIYYRYKDWLFCSKCFSKEKQIVNLDLSINLTASKDCFKECIYHEEKDEEFIKCKMCEREFHERCVLHIGSSSMQFYCNNCRATDVSIAKFPKFKLNAENLASTECDEFIARHLSLCGVFIPKKVIIRLVSNVEKKFEINSPTAKYRSKTAITYNNCSLLAFFKSDDELDICFFACYFQLYGSDCEAKSNRNSVYLSYIDSVNLFKVPDRTKIYQEILIGLFRYLRFRKFSKIFIWSCPPSKQSDYILVGKPLDMKIPTFDILLSWYHKLIILGKKQGVITSFDGPDKYARDNNWFDLDNVPLFEGDLWPTRIQEAVIEAEKEGSNYEYLNKRIWDLLQVQTIGFDNSYFVLYIEQETMTLDAMMPQSSLKCKYTNDRYDLVEFFLDNNLTFLDMRQAKYTTLQIIYFLVVEDFNKLCRNICSCNTNGQKLYPDEILKYINYKCEKKLIKNTVMSYRFQLVNQNKPKVKALKKKNMITAKLNNLPKVLIKHLHTHSGMKSYLKFRGFESNDIHSEDVNALFLETLRTRYNF